jgi:hypothetical protein
MWKERNSLSLLTLGRPIEILGCAAKSRPDLGAGMTAYHYDHNTAELLRSKGIIFGGGGGRISLLLCRNIVVYDENIEISVELQM